MSLINWSKINQLFVCLEIDAIYGWLFDWTKIIGSVQIFLLLVDWLINCLSSGKPAQNKAGPKDKRKVIEKQMHRKEEFLRGSGPLAQVKQGQWLNLESAARLGET